VSRTPIRETLIQLASMGLVVIRPRRGAIVAELGPQQLVEMFEVMSELEATCGRLAARRMTPAEQQALLAAHQACQQALEAQEPDAYYYKNEVFHEAIYAGSHNQFLIEQTRALYRRLRPYRRLQLRVRNRLTNSYSEHDGVVKAILDGDGELAAQLREHVMIQGQRFSDLMAPAGWRVRLRPWPRRASGAPAWTVALSTAACLPASAGPAPSGRPWWRHSACVSTCSWT
jgi:DNA-binding GntR family transcriptional regulator